MCSNWVISIYIAICTNRETSHFDKQHLSYYYIHSWLVVHPIYKSANTQFGGGSNRQYLQLYSILGCTYVRSDQLQSMLLYTCPYIYMHIQYVPPSPPVYGPSAHECVLQLTDKCADTDTVSYLVYCNNSDSVYACVCVLRKNKKQFTYLLLKQCQQQNKLCKN